MASRIWRTGGVPVAAYPVTGPVDVVEDGVSGALDDDLGRAALRAFAVDPRDCRAHALRFGWDASAREFGSNLVLCRGNLAPPATSLRPPRNTSAPHAQRSETPLNRS